jgi:cation diffusion facilitator CzcD-associated flavoprotein CzcO
MSAEEVDVLILGAGLSGIGMAAQLARRCPGKRFVVLERRARVGGTWDLFRYPGVRCDSDMFTLGYAFRPWTGSRTIADAASIRQYIEDVAREHGVLERVRFGHRVVRSSWSSRDSRWTVTAALEDGGESRTFHARFVVDCSGFYDYDRGHRPRFEGESDFEGRIVHAQSWDPGYDFADQRVVVVGSGATAVTMVPTIAQRAAHVTMLQRSPAYLIAVPSHDATVRVADRWLPHGAVASLVRARNTALQLALFELSRRRPEMVRRLLLGQVKRRLGDSADMRDFTPSYAPWDQRPCVVPDGDFFRAIRAGRASVVTDHIARFERNEISLRSGRRLPADLVVLATGFELALGGGAALEVDGREVVRSERLTYRSTLVEGVPNFAMVFGYVNVSWTRKADLVSEYVCRLLQHLDRTGCRQVTPRGGAGFASDEAFVPIRSGYVSRGARVMPRQGRGGPWRARQNVFYDLLTLRWAPLRDRFLEFSPG